MSHSKNSRKGSKKGNSLKGFWSSRADNKADGGRGPYAKKRTHKVERENNKPKDKDFE